MNQALDFFRPREADTALQILAKNESLAVKGLAITPADARCIAETHTVSLRENRLVEIGSGSVEKIIEIFSDSPYADRGNFASLVSTMTEAFCYLKREADREVSDTAVIEAMRNLFDEVSCGSEELFLGREMDILLSYLRENRLKDGKPDYSIREEDNYGAEPDSEY